MRTVFDCTKILPLFLLLLPGLTGCASARVRPPTASLSPDSLALLREAVQQVRPAYATQAEAIRAGAYGSAAAGNPSSSRASTVASGVQGKNGLEALSLDGSFVIQIAAYEDRRDASDAALLAEDLFPSAAVIIERAGEFFRVALVGWESESAAQMNLYTVQRSYPGAWVRTRGIP